MEFFIGVLVTILFLIPMSGPIEQSGYNQAVRDCKENKPICEATYKKLMAEDQILNINAK